MTYRSEDKPVLVSLVKNGSRQGDTISELSKVTGFSVARLVSVAKRYNGQKLGRVTIVYCPPKSGPGYKIGSGIKNPMSGVSRNIPAEICVEVAPKA